MKKSIIILFMSLIVISIIFFPQYNNTNNKKIITTDYPISLDIDKLIKESAIVVKGRYTGYIESWNMARNSMDVSKPADDIYIEGKVFAFDVDEYIKGNGPRTINVNLRYKQEEMIDERYIEPTINEEVVLFLSKDKVFDLYYGSMEPFEFKLTNRSLDVKTNLLTENLEVKTNLNDIKNKFKDNRINKLELIDKVKKLK